VVATASSVVSRGLSEGGSAETKGHMECNGIMLDAEAVIHAVPELKATHPDTELSHEAAVGKIAGEQLNYLMSRGLTEEQARALIIRGFLDVKIKGLPASLQKVIDTMIEQAMSKEAI
jgi:Fe-S cluster assembly scaffold protein SufB